MDMEPRHSKEPSHIFLCNKTPNQDVNFLINLLSGTGRIQRFSVDCYLHCCACWKKREGTHLNSTSWMVNPAPAGYEPRPSSWRTSSISSRNIGLCQTRWPCTSTGWQAVKEWYYNNENSISISVLYQFLCSSIILLYNTLSSVVMLPKTAVFSPGRGLARFPQEKLKWRIKTKKMRPLGRRGKLRVKRT